MEQYFDNFIHTLPDCELIAQKYGLERCLVACKDFCDALDSDTEEIFSRDDECLREIIRLAVAKFGARNLYAAFLHISGNVEAADLHLQAHRFIVEQQIANWS
ncbi:hypothetical protein NIES267_40950 [Calothrix parasitica NIES-267]|uniref:Uncharacterized protein n=1 Tax=Calothrix parasitica NIES-267 TaxID=1973488 RepID=A0A1Z4LTP5_9CYAN|nr:hypothetical protein NIES267_40950 [Calothrix parasitica NIES-267]